MEPISKPKYTIKYSVYGFLDKKVKVGNRPTKHYNFEKSIIDRPNKQFNIDKSFFVQQLQEGLKQKQVQLTGFDEIKLLDPHQTKTDLNVDEYPYSAVGIIEVSTKEQVIGYATGALIGPKHVLTLAHNWYSKEFQDQFQIEFIPSPIHKRKGKGFKVARKLIFDVQICHISEGKAGFVFECAVLELDTQQNLQVYFGSFGFDFFQDKYWYQNNSQKMSVIGYPENTQLTQYNVQAFVESVYLVYNMPITKGMYGGPLFCRNDQDFIILGIHASNIQQPSSSYGISLKLERRFLLAYYQQSQDVVIEYNAQAKYPTKEDLLLFLQQIKESLQKQKNRRRNKFAIYLGSNNLGAQGCSYLLQGQWSGLQKLNLYDNNIGDIGCRQLSKAIKWKNLQELCLSGNSIGAEGCKYLSQAQWNDLHDLDMQSNNIGDEGCKYLSQANWKNLQTIKLENNNIGSVGARHLSYAKWNYLQKLQICWNNIGVEGCSYLAQANWFLEHLEIKYNKIEKRGFERLQSKFDKVFCQEQYQRQPIRIFGMFE